MESWKICNFDPKASESRYNFNISNVGYYGKNKNEHKTRKTVEHLQGIKQCQKWDSNPRL